MKQPVYFPRVAFGGALYCLLEMLWRGYSHVSMFLVGGFCFWLLSRIGRLVRPLWQQALLGAAAVTAVEFCSGLLLNRVLHLNVWDYSAHRFNLLGQICLLYAVLWIPLCAAGILLNRWLDQICVNQALRQLRRRGEAQ